LGGGPGGTHGYHISRWMIALLGIAGTGFVLAILFSVFILFTTPILQKIRQRKEKPGTEETETSTAGEPAEDRSDTSTGHETIDHPSFSEEETVKDDFIINSTGGSPGGTAAANEEERSDDIEITVEKETSEESVAGDGTAGELQDYDPTLELPHYKLPPLSLLKEYDSGDTTVTNEELISNKNRIVETLASYKIKIDKIKATIGPTVTLYEIVPAPGIRISKIKNLEDDIALSLAALGIRIIAPIPGKGTIGIEVPNQTPRIVAMKTILSSRKFQESDFELAIALGKTIANETFTFDLTKMPHLLVAGATGQGKSVGLNAIIASLLYKKHPAQLKFVMIDPKKVELSLFSRIENHFLAKLEDSTDAIITDTQKVISTLNALCAEMDERYDLLQMAHVRNIKEYNKKFISRRLNPEKGHRYMPFIVVVIDEFADLIMTAGRSIETPISRLAQLARAIGIHLVIATQRPTTNIITGVIKANFPARIAFRVSSGIDSRTILDGPGADQLIGRGDMLFMSGNEPVRIQCAFIDTPEIDDLTDFIGDQKGYSGAMELKGVDDNSSESPEVDLKKRDDLFEEAARLVVLHQQGSTSLIQRKLALGYNRAGRIVDQLEAAGILGPPEGSKARQVLPKDDFSLEQILNEL
ncbi:MAG: DNA translocase FtsK, partial [Bacteroidales bacterium]|nr:DNA translocase FtsK [Bacteroidales bacterium]